MVYRGPSKGCKTCRARHVKCDLLKPSCGNCTKRKQPCPGYGDVFGNSHRNENGRILRRLQKPTSNTASTKENLEVVEFNNNNKAKSAKEEALKSILAPTGSTKFPASISPDVEFTALCFFFRNYGFYRDDTATCGYIQFLPQMYTKTAPSSSLMLATSALAINVTALWNLKGGDTALAREFYAKAVTCAAETIKDPNHSKSNELLMTTLILEAYDAINARCQSKPPPAIHASGALALIKHRASLNYRDEISRRLVIAARSRSIHHAVTELIDAQAHESVWVDPAAMPKSPAIEADKIAFEYAQLQRLMPSSEFKSDIYGQEMAAYVLSRALDIRNRCTQWLKTLPASWHPVTLCRDDIDESIKSAGMYGAHCDVYSSLDIAQVRNWHRIIEFGILKIILKCATVAPDTSVSVIAEEILPCMQSIVDHICASVPFFLGNVIKPTSPLLASQTRFPRAPAPSADPSCQSYPESPLDHAHQAMCSGFYVLHGQLTPIVRLIGTDDKFPFDLMLRDGQLEWIRRQLARLRNIFFLG